MPEEKQRQGSVMGFYTHKQSGERYEDKNGNPYMTGVVQETVTLYAGKRYNIFMNTYKKKGDSAPDRKMLESSNDRQQQKPVANEGDQEI